MTVESMDLVWITVKDVQEAVKFYTEVVGLQLKEMSEQWGWAELQGKNGARLGICQSCDENPIKAGENGIVTFTVKDLDQAKADMMKKGAQCVGDIQEVPGHVRMQMVRDSSGNHFQLVQKLY